MRLFPLAIACTLLTTLALAAAAGGAQTPEQVRLASRALKWREIGPTIVGGRISDLAVVESDPSTFYVGTATGGIWKTRNAGITFEPLFQNEATASIGDVTVAPSNPNVVWVGTGEPQNRQSSPWGNGVYRSLDGGRTWAHLGLENTHHIARILVHPRDPDVAWVAAVGHLWGSNAERGVYRTTDGGATWSRVLYVDEHTGAIDLAMDPQDPRTLFAAMYQRQRRAWGFNGGGPGSGLYRTTDGGETWMELGEGLPEGDEGRIGVDVYRRDGSFVCAVVEADPTGADDEDEGEERDGVYCSTDRGLTWEHRSTTNNRPMYYSQIRIDPNDPQRIYLGGADLYRSSDGGRTFTDDAAADVHPDHHALWIDPADSDHLILGSDGGISVSWDRSDSWYQLRNLPIAQFYEIDLDMRDPYHVCGGLQDNGSWCAPSETLSNQGIRTRDWYNVGSGDGFFAVLHPTDSTVLFAESQGGNLTRVNRTTGERARIRPIGRPEGGVGLPELRWNWNTPVVMSSHDPSTVYIGANVLFESTDLGQTWEQISPDLSWGIDRDTLEIMGVGGGEPQMSRHDGQSSYGNMTALAESPLDANVLYTGTDDGRVQVTRDGGATWTDVTAAIPGLPRHTYVTRLLASHADPGTVYAVFDGHRSDDFAPYLFVSTNFGGQWRPIVNGLPQSSLNAIAQHPRNPSLLFAGNEIGVYVSVDGGGQWVELKNNLPTVPVDDIEIHPRENDLVIGTHGRGIWIMADITPLERLSPGIVASAAYVYPVRRTTSYNPYAPQSWTPGIWAADNPPYGALIRYWLATDRDDVTLRIADPMGADIRTLEPPGRAGLNEVVWDLRLAENDARGEPMEPGPRVLPGTYVAELMAGSDIVQSEIQVRLDPRVGMARRDLMARHQAMMDAYRLSGPVDAAEETLEAVGVRLDEIETVLEATEAPPSELTARVEELRRTVGDLADELDEASEGAGLLGRIEGYTGPPSADQLWQIEQAWERVPPILERVNRIVEGELPALAGRVYADAVRPRPLDPVPMPSRGR